MRLFVPSWQQPGTWLENIEALAGEAWIEGIELLFFSWDAEARLAFEAEVERIVASRERFAFSLHLPDPLPGDVADLVAATSSFVERYVFHPWNEGRQLMRFSDWRDALNGLFADYGLDRFSLEYTGADPFAESSALFPSLAICADTGRLLRDGLDPATWISERASQIGEVHLHGAAGDRDHLPLTGGEPWLPGILGLAGKSDWIVDLETFSLEATRTSGEALKRWR